LDFPWTAPDAIHRTPVYRRAMDRVYSACEASRHQLGEPLRRDEPIAAVDEGLDLAPVRRFVQTDADPALGAEIGGNEKSRRTGAQDHLPGSLRDLAPEGKPIAPRPFQGENLVVDAIRRPAPHKLLMRSGKLQTDRAQSRADRNERHLKAPISRRLTLSTERSAPHVDPADPPPIA
jgi:hypothetical protein